MILFYHPQIGDHHYVLDPDESKHCVRVLRKAEGDTINLTDGRGFYYQAVITDANPAACRFQIQSKEADIARPYSVSIAIAPTKNQDRLEWFVEKSVEIGIDKIILMRCDHSERTIQKPDRLKKVAISAMKQSLKARLPELTPLLPFKDVVQQSGSDQKFIAFVDSSNPDMLNNLAIKGKSYLVLIGPEGDFSNEEIAHAKLSGFHIVSLGHSRLRTETAGVVACHILNLVNL